MVNTYFKKPISDKNKISLLTNWLDRSKISNQRKSAEIRFLRLQLEYIRNKLNLILDKEYYDGLKAFDFIGENKENGI